MIGCPCPLKKECCKSKCQTECCDTFEKWCQNSEIQLKLKSGEHWIKATNIQTMFEALQQFQTGGLTYRIVAGNTASGIYFKQNKVHTTNTGNMQVIRGTCSDL